jgi:hypothetical protein
MWKQHVDQKQAVAATRPRAMILGLDARASAGQLGVDESTLTNRLAVTAGVTRRFPIATFRFVDVVSDSLMRFFWPPAH